MSLVDQIVSWMQEQAQAAGAAGFVVGLSGGVDSACVAALSRRAMGPAVVGLVMPCHSDPIDAEHARLVAETFDVEKIDVDLTPVYDTLVSALPAVDSRMALANLKPRLRMTALYYVANARDYLVAGTGNKSELMVGYFTKYGDGGVDVEPLGGLYKREVYGLARRLGVPQPILDRPPTAGLWAGQTDEAEMGMTYDTLERGLISLTIGGDHGVDPADLEQIRRMRDDSAHKRALPPIFVPGSS